MDPLSLSANIIAVVSAATTTARTIQQIVRIREVPYQILRLQNEVSDSRALFAIIQQTVNEATTISSFDLRAISRMQDLPNKAHILLEQIGLIVDSGLKCCEDRRRLKISWRSWMKNRSKLEKHTASLRDVGKDIAETLNLLTASEVPRVRMILRTISFGMESMKDQVSSMAASLGTNESNLSNLQSVVKHPENSRPALSRKTALDRLLPPIRSGPPNPRLSVQIELQGQCRPLCLCVCHTVA